MDVFQTLCNVIFYQMRPMPTARLQCGAGAFYLEDDQFSHAYDLLVTEKNTYLYSHQFVMTYVWLQ